MTQTWESPIPSQACPLCGKTIGGGTHTGDRAPGVADFAVCIYCHGVLVIGEQMRMRPADADETKRALKQMEEERAAAAAGPDIQIHSIYALLADNDKGEGLCMIWEDGLPMPVVFTDADRTSEGGNKLDARLDAIRRGARQIAKEGNRSVRLVRFTTRDDLEVFHPDGRRERTS